MIERMKEIRRRRKRKETAGKARKKAAIAAAKKTARSRGRPRGAGGVRAPVPRASEGAAGVQVRAPDADSRRRRAQLPLPLPSPPSPAFAFPAFRALWAGAFVSSVGTWTQDVALSWLIHERYHDPFYLEPPAVRRRGAPHRVHGPGGSGGGPDRPAADPPHLADAPDDPGRDPGPALRDRSPLGGRHRGHRLHHRAWRSRSRPPPTRPFSPASCPGPRSPTRWP